MKHLYELRIISALYKNVYISSCDCGNEPRSNELSNERFLVLANTVLARYFGALESGATAYKAVYASFQEQQAAETQWAQEAGLLTTELRTL